MAERGAAVPVRWRAFPRERAGEAHIKQLLRRQQAASGSVGAGAACWRAVKTPAVRCVHQRQINTHLHVTAGHTQRNKEQSCPPCFALMQVVKPREVKAGKDGMEAWAFDAVPLLVRCPQAALGRCGRGGRILQGRLSCSSKVDWGGAGLSSRSP